MLIRPSRYFYTFLIRSSPATCRQIPARSLSNLCQRQSGLQPTLKHWLGALHSRYCMWKLRRLLAPDFDEYEFLKGARQAATLIIKAVHQANWSLIRSCCTDPGACALYGLSQSQRNIQYTQLVRFESQHLCQVTPIAVQKHRLDGRSYVYVNISFVGLRDVRDFGTEDEQQEMIRLMKEVVQPTEMSENIAPNHRRVVLGEFQLTLRKELADTLAAYPWLVDFYHVYGFRLVNYSPITLQYRVIEFLKPV